MTYQEYLQSEDWQQKRAQKFREARHHRCAICRSRTSLEVHHLNYRNWFDVQMSDLRILCRRCHEVAHAIIRSGLVLVGESNSRFLTLRKAVRSTIEGKDWYHLAPRSIQDAIQRRKANMRRMESKVLPKRYEIEALAQSNLVVRRSMKHRGA